MLKIRTFKCHVSLSVHVQNARTLECGVLRNGNGIATMQSFRYRAKIRYKIETLFGIQLPLVPKLSIGHIFKVIKSKTVILPRRNGGFEGLSIFVNL